MSFPPFDIHNDRLLTKKEVAEILRYSTREVDRIVAREHLRKIKLPGGAARFKLSDVRQLIEKGFQ